MTHFRFSWAGCGLLAIIVLIGLGVQFCIIAPAMKPLPNGNYGEMFGPVNALRWPFYGLVFIAVGWVTIHYFCARE